MPTIDDAHLIEHLRRLTIRKPTEPLPNYSESLSANSDEVFGFTLATLRYSWNLIERLRVFAEQSGDFQVLRDLEIFDRLHYGNRAIAAAYEADEKSAHQQKDIPE